MDNKEIDQLLSDENVHLDKLHKIVKDSLKAEMQIRSVNKKIDLLLEEQFKTLFETQEKQLAKLKEISFKLNHATL